ncbi:MAG: glycoside hydrolase domain-containing protein [Nocardioidaceae bacterium]
MSLTKILGRSAAQVFAGLTGLTALATLLAGGVLASPARAANVVTPGNFTGYGFDQCTAPSQRAMDAWLTGSPYWAVGIYISGDSRGCLSQPNLTPTWVRTQLARGWRLLPITLGPQAWCTTRERYLRQVRISPNPLHAYAKARAQGRAEARKTVAVASRLGLRPRSTLWYDLEAFPTAGRDCRESALNFLNAWTRQLHGLGYRSGAYSSAASGIKILDDARVSRPGAFLLPDQLWIADWNGHADVFSSYVRNSGWMPHRRVHQYRGGHDETYNGVTINIDNDWLDLGRGSNAGVEPRHCGGAATYNFRTYGPRSLGDRGVLVKTAQCLLKVKGVYGGPVDGLYDAAVGAAVRKYRVSRGLASSTSLTRPAWVALLADGPVPLQKYGAAGPTVRRLQRALNAADGAGLSVTGVFAGRTMSAVKRYQGDHGMRRTGVAGTGVWSRLTRGTP